METPKTAEDICPACNGMGFTAEHDSPSRHGEDGECVSCPIQVQCETCEGTGKVIFTDTGIKFK
jgi:RecJ-like exonuclease